MDRIATSQCLQLVQKAAAATASGCPVSPPASPKVEFDSLAASFGALAVAITIGATVIAIIVAIVGYAWGRAIVREATADARDEANRLIRKWLEDEAPKIIREGGESLKIDGSDINNSLENPADKIGEAAG